MKKILKISMMICCVFMFVGCNIKPIGVSDKVYKIGVKALEVTDEYLDYEITIEEAYTLVSRLNDDLEEEYENQKDNKIRLLVSSLTTRYEHMINLNDSKLTVDGFRDTLAYELNRK